MTKKQLYKVSFFNHGKVYELYAREVSQSSLNGFIEIGGFQFNEHSEVIVDPSEEKLKTEFSNVECCYVPMHAVIRIDKVKKLGASKIKQADGKENNITPFPMYSPSSDSNKT